MLMFCRIPKFSYKLMITTNNHIEWVIVVYISSSYFDFSVYFRGYTPNNQALLSVTVVVLQVFCLQFLQYSIDLFSSK